MAEHQGALTRLLSRLPQIAQGEAQALLDEAEGMLLALTGRQALPGALETAKVHLAVVLYNRQGVEGQTTHSEGGVSRGMDGIPQEILRQAAPYRLAKVVRMNGHEAL